MGVGENNLLYIEGVRVVLVASAEHRRRRAGTALYFVTWPTTVYRVYVVKLEACDEAIFPGL